MEQFDWPHVAQIAGVLLTLLLGTIGTLLGVLLYRQKGARDVMISEMKRVHTSIEKRVEVEIVDRRKSMRQFYLAVEGHRAEAKEDVEKLYNKLDRQSGEIITNFKDVCANRQQACSAILHAEMAHQKELLQQTCSKITKVQDDRNTKWIEQRKLNMELLSKTNRMTRANKEGTC